MNTTIADTDSAVQRAAKTAVPVAPDALAQVFRTAESARTELSNLLPLEQGQKEKLNTVAHTNTHKVAVLAAMQATGEKYLEFPMEPMTWRDDKKLPELVPFSLTQNSVIFHSSGFSEQSVPTSVRGLYKDVNQTLAGALATKNAATNAAQNKMWLKWWLMCLPVIALIMCLIPGSFLGIAGKIIWGIIATVAACGVTNWITQVVCEKRYGKLVEAYQVRASFDGLIPETIRQKIRRAASLGIFTEIFVLAEVPGLKIEEGQAPRLARVGDPLVIGYDGSGFWLIAAFDTSPAEAIAMSMTLSPGGQR